MFKAYAPFLIQFSPEARAMLGCSLSAAAPAAFRAVAAAQVGFDLAHVPVTIGDGHYAASSRVMRSGTIVIELDIAPAALSPRVVTNDAYRAGAKAVMARSGRAAR